MSKTPKKGKTQQLAKRVTVKSPADFDEMLRLIATRPLRGQQELNLAAIVGESVEARERRLVPRWSRTSSFRPRPVAGIQPRSIAKGVLLSRW
jgi:anti-sigma factor RsiW